MATIYLTISGDRLDQICRRFYGDEKNGSVETVLDANRGLAAHGPIYPAGTRIVLPDLPREPKILQVVHLWS